ncbi:MAG: exodeoxyribonuclease VII large subunit [bacterium]
MSDLFTLQDTKVDKSLDLQSSTSDDDFLSIRLKAKDLGEQIDWVTTHRKIDFLQALLKLKDHKSIQVRRKVATSCGLLGGDQILDNLKQWQLQEADRQTWLILDSAIDKIQRGVSGQHLEKSVQILSVSEALSQVKRMIGEQMFTIEGELSEVRPVRQMYYFGLKDNQDSRLDCMAFVGKVVKSGFPLNEGLSVRATGKFRLGKNSKLYFEIDKIELTGQGQLLRNLKLLEEKLQSEGLFDPIRKRKVRKLPENILLLASSSSAALKDFTKVLNERIGGINIYLLPIKTQGVGAEYELLEKLQVANDLSIKYKIDTVVITRGGGSKDDLFVFNSEKVVRAIHALNRPSIVAIGHERDFSLAELAADLRASTPSNAAELVSLSRSQILAEIRGSENFFKSYFYQKKESYIRTSNQLFQLITYRIQNFIQTAKTTSKRTDSLVSGLVFSLKSETRQLWSKINFTLNNRLFATRQQLPKIKVLAGSYIFESEKKQNLNQKLLGQIQTLVTVNFEQIKSQFEVLYQKLALEDPKLILQKGYALIRQKGTVVETKKTFKADQKTEIEFWDGKIEL